MKAWQAIAISVVLTLFFGTVITRVLMGYTTIEPQLSAPQSADGTPDTSLYPALLEAYAQPSGFRYEAARQDLKLEQAYAVFATTRPSGSAADQFAWDINAYNLLVVVGIARNWPIEDIDDMASAIEPIKGFGYFQARRYRLSGEKISLQTLDKRIRANPLFDVRVPFTQACGLAGCARLHSAPVHGATLDEELDAGLTRFLTNPLLVRINPDEKQYEIGMGFLAMEEALVKLAVERGTATDFDGVLRHYGAANAALIRAMDEGYTRVPMPFSFAIASAR